MPCSHCEISEVNKSNDVGNPDCINPMSIGIPGPEAISCIQECFKDESALLKHELAYCLGQMQDTAAVPTLIDVLRDLKQEPMVRHEAGESQMIPLICILIIP